MLVILSILQKTIFADDVRQYHISKPVPYCECGWGWYGWGKPHPEWSEWEGCEELCSDVPLNRTRNRRCEKNTASIGWYCPTLNHAKRCYDQENFEPCHWIKKCGKKLKYILKFFKSCHQAYWSEWEDDSFCSKSCGIGRKDQKRYCKRGDEPAESWECTGDMGNTKSANCNFQKCRKFI